MIFTEEEAIKERQWADDKKYHAARFAWKNQNRYIPSGKLNWRQWWEKMFSDNLMDYAMKKKKDG